MRFFIPQLPPQVDNRPRYRGRFRRRDLWDSRDRGMVSRIHKKFIFTPCKTTP